MQHLSIKFLILILTIGCFDTLAQREVKMLENIYNTWNGDSKPTRLTATQDNLYFMADDEIHGYELWCYNEEEGARLVADHVPGSSSSWPDFITEAGDWVYYVTTPEEIDNGSNLWKHKGSEDPELVWEFNSGNERIVGMVAHFGKLYFMTDDHMNDISKMWSYDGVNPPVLLDEKAYSGTDLSGKLWAMKGSIYFSWKGTSGRELYRFNEGNGIHLAFELVPGVASSDPYLLNVVDDKLYFSFENREDGRQLWVYDGYSAPTLITRFDGFFKDSNPRTVIGLNGKIYFVAVDNVMPALLVWDGSGNPRRVPREHHGTSNQFWHLADLGGKLVGYETAGGLYVYDDLDEFPRGVGCRPYESSDFATFKDKLYFSRDLGDEGHELWSYDHENGCQFVVDINLRNTGSSPASFMGWNNKLYFATSEGGTVMRAKIPGEPSQRMFGYTKYNRRTNPSEMVEFEGKLFFTGRLDTYAEKDKLCYIEPGEGPKDLQDTHFFPINGGQSIHDLTVYGDKLFFLNRSGEIWSYNEAEGVTWFDTAFVDLEDGNMRRLKAHDGSLYFMTDRVASNDFDNNWIWRYDGFNPPYQLKDFRLNSNTTYVEDYMFHEDKIYVVNELTSRRELWVANIDGTGEWVKITEDIREDFIEHHMWYKGKLYYDGQAGRLMCYDEDQEPFAVGGNYAEDPPTSPEWFVIFEDKLVFSAGSSTGSGIWIYDGEQDPYRLQTENYFSRPEYFYVYQGVLYFSGDDGYNGEELWALTQNSFSKVEEFACASYTSPSGNYTWNTSGTYTDIVENNAGYDSLMTIDLTVTTIDTEVVQDGPKLISKEESADVYQWIDCSTGEALVGEENSIFEIEGSGEFALIIEKNGCIDTTTCKVMTIGVEELDGMGLQVYPNPGQNEVVLQGSSVEQVDRIVWHDLTGKKVKVLEPSVASGERLVLNIQDLKSGTYAVQVHQNGQVAHFKWIKL